MIRYTYDLTGIDATKLQGFFVGWPNPPSCETHLKILEKSAEIVLAIDESTGSVVGFINAISDGIMAAYIPLLEVLPEYKGRGIGKELVRRMLERLEGLYVVDLMCDEELQPFYERFGMKKANGMMIRRYEYQSCIGHTA